MKQYFYTGRNSPALYNRYGMPSYLGADFTENLKDKNFLITSGLIAAGTIAALVVFKKFKKGKRK